MYNLFVYYYSVDCVGEIKIFKISTLVLQLYSRVPLGIFFNK